MFMKKIKPVLHNLLFMYKQIYKISPMRIYMVFIMSLVQLLSSLVDIYFLKFIVDGLISEKNIMYFA